MKTGLTENTTIKEFLEILEEFAVFLEANPSIPFREETQAKIKMMQKMIAMMMII